ncbi:MAG: hypothetical protein KF809_15055 [Chloroflexi bacterium]|nr:hypothetical protein [Chloroflexota bacterium]
MRKASWALVIWSVLMGLWVVAGLNATNDACIGESVTYTDACEVGATIGRGIGVTFIAVVWFVGFIVLGIIWLGTRPRQRLCPACGQAAKSGDTVCRRCGFDFAAAALGSPGYQPPPQGPPPGWGPQ